MSFWRKEPPVLDNGIVVQGGMLPSQRLWWDSQAFIKAFIGGYGSGKTFIAAKRAIALALHNAPSPHLMISPSYKIAKKTTIQALRQLLSGKQSLQNTLRWKHNKTSHEFKIWFRGREATIWVASGDDPDSLKGPNVGSGHIDEPFIQDKEVLDQSIARIRDPLARVKELGLSGTPEQLNWGYDICEGEEAANYNVDIVRVATMENITLGDAYHKRLLAALTPEAARAYIYGEFVNLTTGRVYYGVTGDNFKHIDDPGGDLCVGMDFNVNPMAAVVFWTHGNHIHFIEEIELPNADTEYMCNYLQTQPQFQNADGTCRIKTVYPDASGANRSTKSPGGKSDFYYLKRAGFTVDAPPANPSVRDRENAVNGKANPSTGEPTLTFEPSMRKARGYLHKYTHTEKHKPAHRAMSHLLDAMSYPVHRLFPVVFDRVQLRKVIGH